MKVVEVLLGEAQGLKVVEDGVESAGYKKIAVARQSAHEEAEDGTLRHALLEVGLKHGELVEVGEERETVVRGSSGGTLLLGYFFIGGHWIRNSIAIVFSHIAVW